MVFLQQPLLQQSAQQHWFTFSILFSEERIRSPLWISCSPRHNISTLTAQLHLSTDDAPHMEHIVSVISILYRKVIFVSPPSFRVVIAYGYLCRIILPAEMLPKLGTSSEREVICVSLKKDPKLGLGKDITHHFPLLITDQTPPV